MATNVIKQGAIPVLTKLMLSEDKNMLSMAAGALACIAFHPGPPNDAVHEADVLPVLISVL